MFKRGLSLILSFLLILSIAGCGNSAPETAPTVAPTAAAEIPETTESPTELTLPEKVRQAYDEGIVALDMLKDPDRICATEEAAAIVQNIYTLHFGRESVVLNQIPASEFCGMETTRHWMSLVMYLAVSEWLLGTPVSDNFTENVAYLAGDMQWDDAAYNYFHNNGMKIISEIRQDFHFAKWFEPDAVVSHILDISTTSGEILGPPDWNEVRSVETDPDLKTRAESEGWIKWLDYGFELGSWVILCADRITGEKIMAGDLVTPFGPREKMTVQEVVETALRFHHFVTGDPEMVPFEDPKTYDTAIITAELLARETTLPEASCAVLPKEWRGITIDNLVAVGDASAQPDLLIQENELQIIQDAGFNFLEIKFDFRPYFTDSICPYDWEQIQQSHQINETRLKELDQVIAWCMERDIHVNLSCIYFIGLQEPIFPSTFRDKKLAKSFAQQWQILAKRYADIPNTYLSFTMFKDPDVTSDKDYQDFFTPVVNAIREESPDRCIIANIPFKKIGKSMGELGVALSSEVSWPEDFTAVGYEMKTKARKKLFQDAAWPYKKINDAESAMTNRRYGATTPDAMAARAAEYGVGYMVSNWDPHSATQLYRERYTDETMEAYLKDFIQILSDRGYGWCYGDWAGYTGIACAYPAVNSTTYAQVDNAPLYIDVEMFSWFQTLNDVN